MDIIRLIYQDNSSGTINTQDISALLVKGFDPIDSIFDFPDVLHQNVEGGFLPRNIGFKRRFTLELGVMSYTNRLFCAKFFNATTKWIKYSHDGYYETVRVVNDSRVLETDWLNNIHIARYVILKLQDKLLLTDFPVQQTTPEFDAMYLKEKVLIAGYIGSTEIFTTNVGKLATADAPAGAYPYFDSATQKFQIDINGFAYQDCHFHTTGLPTTSGGNLSFTIERSDAGNPSADGSYYANIAIYVQTIV